MGSCPYLLDVDMIEGVVLRAEDEVVPIPYFCAMNMNMTSNQPKPTKIVLWGSDGELYRLLLISLITTDTDNGMI